MNQPKPQVKLFIKPESFCEPDPEGSCSVCSDMALPGRVVELLENRLALVEVEGRLREVAIDLVDEVGPGDTLLVHLGVALVKLEPE